MERKKKKKGKKEGKKEEKELKTEKPFAVKYGLNHITTLIEQKKAKLVAIAHDVDPLELVVWLPALCRKMDVPYCVVKGKSRLGQVVHQKTATALALTEVRKEDQNTLSDLSTLFKDTFNKMLIYVKLGEEVNLVQNQLLLKEDVLDLLLKKKLQKRNIKKNAFNFDNLFLFFFKIL